MDKGLIVVLFCLVVAVALFAFILALYAQQKKVKRETQRIITDKDLVLLLANQPDGMLNKNLLAEMTGLSKSEASTRLQAFSTMGIVRMSYTSNFKYFYELTSPVKEVALPELSAEPFLTVDDVLKLFKAYDNQLNYQDLIIATGLPLDIIKREMKYFEKEKVIQTIYTSNNAGTVTSRRIILNEPYRSQPEEFLSLESSMNEKVREILRSDQLI